MGGTADPTNGGRRINKLEVTDAEHTTQIALMSLRIDEIHRLLTDYFGPNGFCVTHQKKVEANVERIESNRSWIKAMWGLAVVILGMTIKAAFF